MTTTIVTSIEIVAACDPDLVALVGPDAEEWPIVAWAITHNRGDKPPFAVFPIAMNGETGAVRDRRTGLVRFHGTPGRLYRSAREYLDATREVRS